jgi:hypothetical protein
MFNNSVRNANKTQHFTKLNDFILSKKIIAAYTENHT